MFSFSLPKVPTFKPPTINIPQIPTPNIPTPGGSLADLPGGVSLLTENVHSGVDDLIGPEGIVTGAFHRLAKVGKEAISGQGGYADDAGPDAPGHGETGYEDATGTLLTRGRKRELAMGRAFHSGGGTASTVS